MLKSLIVDKLDSKKATEIEQMISGLSKGSGSNKQLSLVLDNTEGDYMLAIDLAKKIKASNIDLIIEARGSIDSAGTILATAGKDGERKASLDAIFTPFEENEKSIRKNRLTPKNQLILKTLGYLKANRRQLKSIAPKSETLSPFEARALNIVDKVEEFESKEKKDESRRGKSFTKGVKRSKR